MQRLLKDQIRLSANWPANLSLLPLIVELVGGMLPYGSFYVGRCLLKIFSAALNIIVPCGYSINVVSNHNKTSKPSYYRGEDADSAFCKEIRQIAYRHIDIYRQQFFYHQFFSRAFMSVQDVAP